MGNLRVALCLISGLIFGACGPTTRNPGTTDAPGTTGDDDGQTSCPKACSADLHSVTDCNGTVLMACADDQGCDLESGTCVSACAAAASNKSSIGCDYYAVDPDVISSNLGDCFAAFVANTWGAPVTLTVERNGQQLPVSGFARLPSGSGKNITYAPLTNGVLQTDQVAILFLSQAQGAFTACPAGITPAILQDAAVHGTGYGSAFHIQSSAPVVAYDIFPYGGGSAAITSATLLLPTSAWDVNYVGVDAFRKSQIAGQPFVQIVGTVDGTTVSIRPSAAITGGAGVAATAAGATGTYALMKGQVLQFTQDAELTGSAITADHPVGTWGGASCLSINVTDAYCDAAHQNIPPVRALGHRYAAVRYRNRFVGQEETVPWRIVGTTDGTTLTYSPAAPPGAPTTLAPGQVAEFNSPGQFLVASQDADHPFYMSAHMTGSLVTNPGGNDRRGDPEFVNVIPPEQFLAKYTFFTDPTYPETNLVLTRENAGGGFADVTVDCVGTVTGWTALDASDKIEYARVDLVTGNFAKVGNCDNGLHQASSTQPFGLVVWGWGSAASTGFFSEAVSYAYPAGASVKPINTVVLQ